MTDDEEDRDARATRLIREARDTVRRLKREPRSERNRKLDDLERQPPDDVARTLLPMPDPVAKWRKEMAVFAAEKEAAEAELHTRSGAGDLVYKRHDNAIDETRAGADWSAWNEWADGRIDAAIDAATQGFGEAISKILEDERRDVLRTLRGEIADAKIEASRLAAEVAELRVQLAQYAIDRAKVVDMPSPLSSRRVN
jgi:hypothetical protein